MNNINIIFEIIKALIISYLFYLNVKNKNIVLNNKFITSKIKFNDKCYKNINK